MEPSELPEERLAAQIAALPPAPAGWVQAAKELPAARARMDEIVARAEADNAYREKVIANLEAALRGVGESPTSALVEALRSRLTD